MSGGEIGVNFQVPNFTHKLCDGKVKWEKYTLSGLECFDGNVSEVQLFVKHQNRNVKQVTSSLGLELQREEK